ncbi:putative membrane protein [Wickerhamomyces ciferrii]|uniref:Membrane protein n=1 Tax=Wickerhamomyces ciferrii (strain ATCC 14091 / BCRC 22168 / CBS 111 / JCM 3599 / NBRC 0793 / NRRL Y-1031 F-60-10) TaxID=1206466 RepID=K0KTF5_WICCF|nr:uncharacterized protein BN7_4228 [Wickerhamomyces ciferrii]CCH44659.1 putative membrane protein [Wickerhamomyces ciferrii]
MADESNTLTYRAKSPLYSVKDDLQLLRSAHSSSCSINKIAEDNSMEDDLLSRIDSFISSIEAKLDKVENFFTTGGKFGAEKKRVGNDDALATLQNLYDTLITIKSSVFTKSVNLENFNRILDEHYGHLLSSINSTESLGFHEKLLTGLHFLDAKINQFNNLIEGERKPLLEESTSPEDQLSSSIRSFNIKFYNYERAISQGISRLLHYYELPFPWRENKYIINGYRFQNNHLHALKSICECHNETTNIWTHLIGAMVMLYVCFVDYPSSEVYKQGTFADNAIMYLFLIAGVKCLLSSSFWHTFNGTTNLYLRKKFACIDYTGITVLITTSIITTEHAALHYFPKLKIGYITFSLICGIIGFFFNWSAHFDRPESRWLRIGFFIALAGLGVSAFFSLAFIVGLKRALTFYFPLIRSFIWYLSGVVFYGSLIPERFRSDVIVAEDQPEESEIGSEELMKNIDSYFKKSPPLTSNQSFLSLWWIDYFMSSHNIWHVFVVFGCLGHYSGVYEMFKNKDLNAI